MSTVRVRIAPSPSGFLHIGTAKIALVNWLFARQQGGVFVLRLEDTDADRTDEAFVQAMCDGFSWLGIDWDEGPPFGDEPEKGDLGPYRQSQRAELHREAVQQLLDSGCAYKCFCSKEELDAEREKAQAEKRTAKYSGKCRGLSAEAIAVKGDAPCVVRFRVPDGNTVVEDIVQGAVKTENDQFDDFVIQRASGVPVFHLAVVVDDATMGITHVIRGDDHLTNAAKHQMLFEALSYPVPAFAHLPMVLDERGKKYSKREHGANVLDWRADGYLPEALINYVVLLGWTAGDDKEVYTREELLGAFSLERLGKSAAKFDLKKMKWLNGQHIRMLSVEELRDRVLPILRAEGFDVDAKGEKWLLRMTEICHEKLSTLNEIVMQTDFFFVVPEEYEEKAVKKQWGKADSVERMARIVETCESAEDWTTEWLHGAFEAMVDATGLGLGKYVHPFRLALTGKSVGPGVFELAELLGKDESLARLLRATDYMKTVTVETS